MIIYWLKTKVARFSVEDLYVFAPYLTICIIFRILNIFNMFVLILRWPFQTISSWCDFDLCLYDTCKDTQFTFLHLCLADLDLQMLSSVVYCFRFRVQSQVDIGVFATSERAIYFTVNRITVML